MEGLREQVEAALNALTPKEQQVLRMRFGLGVPSTHSLDEVATAFASTRERIAKIERHALRRLRRKPSTKALPVR
jgi:RNA polymerase primary sigma factor